MKVDKMNEPATRQYVHDATDMLMGAIEGVSDRLDKGFKDVGKRLNQVDGELAQAKKERRQMMKVLARIEKNMPSKAQVEENMREISKLKRLVMN